MNWVYVLNAILWLVDKISKDTDGDGRPDWQDSAPDDPGVQ